MDLSNLKPAKGSTKTSKRIGRGQGSGKGGTSTRGHKGAKSRSGYSKKLGYEGGQMPLARRVPKFGFKNFNRVEYKGINLDVIQLIADKISAQVITVVDDGFSAQMVLAAVGVTPQSGLAQDAGLALSVGNSIAVDRTLRTSDPDIFSAGDCADAYHVVTGRKTWIPLALRANRAGWAVADNVCGETVALDGVAGTAVFRVFGLEVARTGLNVAEAGEAGFEPVEATITSSTKAHSFPGASALWVSAVGDRKTGRLLGMQIVGRGGAAHRINAAAVVLHAGMTAAQFFQTDLAYAPPFGPAWDPMLTCASRLLKKM